MLEAEHRVMTTGTMDRSHSRVRTGGAEDPRSMLVMGAWAGLMAPVLFYVLHFIQLTLAPDFNQLEHPVSALGLERYGWIQSLSFIQFGVLYFLFAWALKSTLEPNLGPWLHMVSAMGCIVLGLTPWHVEEGFPVQPTAHTIGIFMAYLGAGAGFIAMWQPMRNDPRWAPWSWVSLVTGVLMLALYGVFGAVAQGTTARFHHLEGLFQGVMANLWFICTILLALRLLGIARDHAQPARSSVRDPVLHPGEPAA